MTIGTTTAPRFLRLEAVKERTGLSRSGIYLRISRGEFPAQRLRGPRTAVWLEAEVDAWCAREAERLDAHTAEVKAARASRKAQRDMPPLDS
jgi:prophage regulatory protein